MTQGYFYTLSAIAQTFAAIIGLYAIFTIYHLQLLKNQRKELQKQKHQASEESQLTSYISKQEIIEELEKIDKIYSKIYGFFKSALFINGLTIGFSIVCLPLGSSLQTHLMVKILIIAIILSISSLTLTWLLVWSTFKILKGLITMEITYAF